MQKTILFLFVLLFIGIACRKDKSDLVTGRVEVKGGCFSDSWLVAIDNPNPEKHSFLRATTVPTGTFYNCSNAVFINLPSSLAITGTRIRFSPTESIPFSCLSYSEAPNHVKVKNLARL